MAAMFGFSLTKLLGRLDEARKAEAKLQQRRQRRAPTRGGGDGGGAADAEDMVPCPACKAYVPAKGASNCGRPDCPY